MTAMATSTETNATTQRCIFPPSLALMLRERNMGLHRDRCFDVRPDGVVDEKR